MHDVSGKASNNHLNLAREILQRNGLTKISDKHRTIKMDAEELSEDF